MNNVIVMRQLIERLAAVFFLSFIFLSLSQERIKAMYGFYQQPYGEQLIRILLLISQSSKRANVLA